MADFRRWFVAFAVVALLSGLAVTANAQIPSVTQCFATTSVTPTVRAEGLAELTGDLTFSCTGGTPTVAGQAVPQVNFQIFLNTNVTSKLLASNTGGNFNEALLIVDEPHSATNPARPILNCGNTGAPDNGPSGRGVCSIVSDGVAADTYNGTLGATSDDVYAYGVGHPNVFQGRQGNAAGTSVAFLGVPFDPPGTTTTRVLRFTNIRANANALVGSSASTLTSVQAIVANISVSGNTSISINTAQQVIAYILPGLSSSVRYAYTFIQCVSANHDLAAGTSTAPDFYGSSAVSQSGQQFSIRFMEGFATAWKVKNIRQQLDNSTYSGAAYVYNGGTNYNSDNNQNVPGAIYNTESGFEYNANATDPSPNPPLGIGNVAVTSTSYALADSYTGIAGAGVANQGTRLVIAFANVPNGTSLWVPPQITLVRQSDGVQTGIAVLVSTDANGAGAYTPVTTSATTLQQVSLFSGTGIAVYEVLFSDPFSQERTDVPVAVAFVANPGNNLPQPGVQSTATMGFAPFYSTAAAGSASFTYPVPRFVPGTPARNTFIVVKCSCNVLFPYVVNTLGFDTGVVIANTTVDPYGTTPQTGTVTVNYYGTGPGGSAAPAAQTSQSVPGGALLAFTLSGGGNYGIDNRASGFVGYIIAQANFQFCHAVAYIQALGAAANSPGASEMYEGIILDIPGLNRTGQLGEVQAH